MVRRYTYTKGHRRHGPPLLARTARYVGSLQQEAIPRLPRGYPEATPRLPRGYLQHTNTRGSRPRRRPQGAHNTPCMHPFSYGTVYVWVERKARTETPQAPTAATSGEHRLAEGTPRYLVVLSVITRWITLMDRIPFSVTKGAAMPSCMVALIRNDTALGMAQHKIHCNRHQT